MSQLLTLIDKHAPVIRRTINVRPRQPWSHVRGIATIRKCLSTIACKTIIHALVMSRLDYDNTMLSGLPETQTAETADGSKLRSTADYWNPQTRSHNTSFIQFTQVACRQQIEFKLLLLVFRAVHHLCPAYLSSLVIPYTPTHPNTEIRRSTFIDYTTSSGTVVGPFLWQGRHCGTPYPPQLGKPTPLPVFKSLLKTHLFRKAFRTLC